MRETEGGRDASETSDDEGADPPFLAGGLAGLGAALLGYALTYLHVSPVVRDSLAARFLEASTGGDTTWKVVGWVWYNSHEVRIQSRGVFGASPVDFVARVDAISGVLYLVPPLVLALAGGLVVYRHGVETGAAAEQLRGATGVGLGAAVVFGYLPVAALGAVAVRVPFAEAVIGPPFLSALLVAGIGYPVVFGGLGGLVAAMGSRYRG